MILSAFKFTFILAGLFFAFLAMANPAAELIQVIRFGGFGIALLLAAIAVPNPK